jgi:ERCC4-type nuclease
MLRHYDKSVLLIESNSRQTTETPTTAITQPSTSTGSGNRRRIGPFQGEMSKRCRDIRNLFVVLLRYQPKVRLLWSIDPEATTELFAEIKVSTSQCDSFIF